MNKWQMGWVGFLAVTLGLLVSLPDHAYAEDRHCGGAAPKTGNLYKLNKPENHRLELVLHFNPKTVEIPKDCVGKLLLLSEQVKMGAKGKLIIRSTTSTDSSSEMDLAIASERLEQIKLFLRNDRLALRAMQLELYSNPLLHHSEESSEAPRLVEIYSSPVN